MTTIQSTGSIVWLHHLCSSYETLTITQTAGSGSDEYELDICNNWDTSIEIPSLNYFIKANEMSLGNFILALLIVIPFYIILWKVTASVFSFLTKPQDARK